MQVMSKSLGLLSVVIYVGGRKSSFFLLFEKVIERILSPRQKQPQDSWSLSIRALETVKEHLETECECDETFDYCGGAILA